MAIDYFNFRLNPRDSLGYFCPLSTSLNTETLDARSTAASRQTNEKK